MWSEEREIGQIWGDRFEIRKKLGAGGLGVVFEAYDRHRRDRVALKTLLHLDAQGLYNFKQEFRVLSEVRHPNLVRLDELIHDGERWFFSMELLEGPNFLEYVRPQGVLDGQRLRGAMKQLVRGLLALQELGLIHRDIKGNNIMFTAQGRLVILDFGMATRTTEDPYLTRPTNVVAGTAVFMSPEQAQSHQIGPASDWYSVGVLLYLCLVGEYPFDGGAIQVLLKKIDLDAPLIWERGEPVDPELVDLGELAMALLSRDPHQRPTGEEIAERLGVFLEGQSGRGGPEPGSPGRVNVKEKSGEIFIGRREELSRLERLFSESLGGQFKAALFEGSAGVGKSTLVQQFLEKLEGKAEVLRGRCYGRESVPFNGFDGMVDRFSHLLRRLSRQEVEAMLPARASYLGKLFPVLERVEAIGASPQEGAELFGAEARDVAFQVFSELCNRFAQKRPLVLFIDDLHWADEETCLLLEFLGTRIQAPVLFLGTLRRDDSGNYGLYGSDGAKRFAEILGGADLLSLQNLTSGETRELVEALWPADRTPDPGAVERLVVETDGHPMMLHELVVHSHNVSFDRGVHLLDVLQERLVEVDEKEKEILAAISIAGLPLSLVQLQETCTLSAPLLHRALDSLELRRLLRKDREDWGEKVYVYHGRIREAFLAGLDAQAKQIWHNRVADTYLKGSDSRGIDPLLVVEHLEKGGRVELATDYACSAAERATRAFAFDRAVRLYGKALRRKNTWELQVGLAEALLNAARPLDAASAFLVAGTLQEDRRTSRDLRRQAAECYLIGGEILKGFTLLEEVLAEQGLASSRSSLGLLLETLWYKKKLERRGLALLPLPADKLSEEEREELDLLSTTSRQMSFIDPILGLNFRVRTLLRALDIGARDMIAEGIALQAVAEVANHGTRGDAQMESLLETAEILAQGEEEQAIVLGCRAAGTVLTGRHRIAAQLCKEAEEAILTHVRGSQRVTGTSRVRLWMVKCLVECGDFAGARSVYERVYDEALRRGDRLTTMSFVRVAGIAWELAGQGERLDQEIQANELFTPIRAFAILHWFDLRTRGEVALYRGEVEAFFENYEKEIKQVDKTLFKKKFQLARLEILWWQARLYLALAAKRGRPRWAIRKVGRLIQELQQESENPLAVVYRLALICSLERLLGKESWREDALALASSARVQGLKQFEVLALYQLSRAEESTLPEEAIQYLEEHQVLDPERASTVFFGLSGADLEFCG